MKTESRSAEGESEAQLRELFTGFLYSSLQLIESAKPVSPETVVVGSESDY